MKKTKLAIATIIISAMLCGCATQKDYNVLQDEYDTVSKQYDDLLEENRSLKKENEELQAEIEELQNTEVQTTENTVEETDLPEDSQIEISEETTEQDLSNIEWRTDITYDDLSRRPDDYENEYIEISGKVIQLIEDGEYNELRVATNSNGYDDVILVGYKADIVSERILEDDSIIIRGASAGIIQYESTLGGLISVPSIYAVEIERQ